MSPLRYSPGRKDSVSAGMSSYPEMMTPGYDWGGFAADSTTAAEGWWSPKYGERGGTEGAAPVAEEGNEGGERDEKEESFPRDSFGRLSLVVVVVVVEVIVLSYRIFLLLMLFSVVVPEEGEDFCGVERAVAAAVRAEVGGWKGPVSRFVHVVGFKRFFIVDRHLAVDSGVDGVVDFPEPENEAIRLGQKDLSSVLSPRRRRRRRRRRRKGAFLRVFLFGST